MREKELREELLKFCNWAKNNNKAISPLTPSKIVNGYLEQNKKKQNPNCYIHINQTEQKY